MPSAAPLSSDLRNCVVCGLGSHRTDWVKRAQVGNTLYVACDIHTDQEMQAAVNAAEVKAKKEAAASQEQPKTAAATAAPPSDALKQAAAKAAQK